MEQALVFASIVLGVGVAFEVENLNRLLRAKNVRWHWAQPFFALLTLLLIMSYWWNIAASEEDSITMGEFLPIMWTLVTLNLLAAVSLPDEIDANGLDLAVYYQQNRRYMWSLLFFSGLPHEILWLREQAYAFPNLGTWLLVVWGDLVAYAIMFALIFVQRWWIIAVGMSFLALATMSWYSRTLG